MARAFDDLPLLAEALGRGELSYAKMRALTRVDLGFTLAAFGNG